MKINSWKALGTTGALVMTMGCAAHHAATPPPPTAEKSVTEEGGAITGQSTVTVTSTVVRVDQKNRVVTLRNAEGEVADVQVGDEVRNLPQVKPGDRVVATYHETITITVRKPGEATPGITTASTAARAKPGERPAGAVGEQTTIVATVTAVDKSAGTLTVKGPRGKIVTIKAREARRLENIKVGDLVEAVYTEVVAISVEKPTRK